MAIPRTVFGVRIPFAKKSKASDTEDPKSSLSGEILRLPKPGENLQLDGFGGEVELSDGEKATLRNLVDISVGGVIIFTYPKANTPACTAQACFFRDCYADLRNVGFSIYGLSRDTIAANKNFQAQYELPFNLICDQNGSLIQALGFANRAKTLNRTTRGVVVIDKDGTVLASVAGTPDATVHAVLALLGDSATHDPAAGAGVVKDVVHEPVQHRATAEIVHKAKVATTATAIAAQLGTYAARTSGGP